MDKLIRATAADGMIKAVVVTARDTTDYARRIHSCSHTASAALGRALCAASMLGDMLKEENASLTIRINGGGPVGSVIAVSDSNGCVRGCIDNPVVELPLRQDGKLDVGGAVGKDGFFTVSKDIGLREPYIGSVKLISGEIAEDLTSYLLESEQVPSASGLGVLVDTDDSILAAGGFIVQLMPGADESLIQKLEDNIFLMDQLTTILNEDGAEQVFAQLFRNIDYHIVSSNEIMYKCYCTRDRVEEAISCIDSSELQSMINSGETISVRCQFCQKEYSFSSNDLSKLIKT